VCRPAGAAARAAHRGARCASLKFFGDAVQAAAFEPRCSGSSAAGATIVPSGLRPFYDVARMLYEGAWVAERYTVIEDLLKHNPDAVHPGHAGDHRQGRRA
jgi:allophanate hydrolase